MINIAFLFIPGLPKILNIWERLVGGAFRSLIYPSHQLHMTQHQLFLYSIHVPAPKPTSSFPLDVSSNIILRNCCVSKLTPSDASSLYQSGQKLGTQAANTNMTILIIKKNNFDSSQEQAALSWNSNKEIRVMPSLSLSY